MCVFGLLKSVTTKAEIGVFLLYILVPDGRSIPLQAFADNIYATVLMYGFTYSCTCTWNVGHSQPGYKCQLNINRNSTVYEY